MGSRRRRPPAVWFWFPFLMAFQLCASLNQEGSAVLGVKEVIDADPYGALLDWDKGDVSPCSCSGVKCSEDGRVMALNTRSAATRKLLENKHKGSRKNKIDGSGAAPSVPSAQEIVFNIPPAPFQVQPFRSPLHPRESLHPPNPPPPPSLEVIPAPPVSSVVEQTAGQENKSSRSSKIYALIGTAIFLLVVALLAALFCNYRRRNTSTVVPFPATSSIRLRTTATEGITLFRLSQIEKACEGFSNIIGTLPGCTMYKGTLPCGAEIAVVSTSVAYAGDWSPTAETHFRDKVEILSMVNHKNLMNLVGYCDDEEPFTRMLVFEYVSNGSLQERLHVKEAEHLNWQARLRIAMGVIYCLKYLCSQSPPVNLRNLDSSVIYLSEDNAAKISDINFYDGKKEGEDDFDVPNERSTVYKFALLLLEIVSGRRPYSDDDGLLVLWAHRYLTADHPVMGMVDPTLNSVPEDQVRALSELILTCINEVPWRRPTIDQVTKKMKDITGITQDQAIPRNNSLWWAELEIITL